MNVNQDSKPKTNMTLLIVINILFGLVLIPACVMVMFSPMLFDAPGSQDSWLTWFLLFGFLSFPVLIVISIIATWVFYAAHHYKIAFWVSLLPLVSVGWIVLALILLQTLQGGNLSSR